MENQNVGAALNFFVPGSGFWYLGKHRWAIANLFVATGILLSAGGIEAVAERIHYVILAVAAGSAGLAHAVGSNSRAASPSNQASYGQNANSESLGKSE